MFYLERINGSLSDFFSLKSAPTFTSVIQKVRTVMGINITILTIITFIIGWFYCIPTHLMLEYLCFQVTNNKNNF